MPRRQKEPIEEPEITEDEEDEELKEEWIEMEEDWSELDLLDEIEDWLKHEADWDEDKYQESH